MMGSRNSINPDDQASLAPEPKLDLPRTLDLNRVEDRGALLKATSDPELQALIENTLDDYLRWFSVSEWRRVYSGGLVNISGTRGTATHSSGFGIDALLKATAQLQSLQKCEGFDQLLAGLKNRTQIHATLFEIAAAGWCAERAVHRGLIFSPTVRKAHGYKHPDFLWKTSLGDLTCECKEADQWLHQETRAINHLREIASAALTEAGGLPDDNRLDIQVNGALAAGYERRLADLVKAVAAKPGESSARLVAAPFSATVVPRRDPPERPRDSMIASEVIVGTTPTRIAAENAVLTVTRSLATTRARRVRDLVKRAKSQLPDEGPCGVFIQINGAEFAAEQLEEMIGRPAHQAIVWAETWTGMAPQHAIWRQNQPFDGRLLDER